MWFDRINVQQKHCLSLSPLPLSTSHRFQDFTTRLLDRNLDMFEYNEIFVGDTTDIAGNRSRMVNYTIYAVIAVYL